jgi:hypothetical protein
MDRSATRRHVKEEEMSTTNGAGPDSDRRYSDRIKISMNILRHDWEELRKWAANSGTNASDIIRRALVLYRYLLDETDDNETRIVLRRKGRPDRELVIRAIS